MSSEPKEEEVKEGAKEEAKEGVKEEEEPVKSGPSATERELAEHSKRQKDNDHLQGKAAFDAILAEIESEGLNGRIAMLERSAQALAGMGMPLNSKECADICTRVEKKIERVDGVLSGIDFEAKGDDFDPATDPDMQAFRAERKACVKSLQATLDRIEQAKKVAAG